MDPDDKKYPWTFRGDVSNRRELNCSKDFFVDFARYTIDKWPSVRGWINTTACTDNETDIRLFSVLAWYESDSIPTNTLAVLCKPSFVTKEAVMRADWITGDVLEYNVSSSLATQQHIHTSMDAIYIYLNNPLDSRTQWVYTSSSRTGEILVKNSQNVISTFFYYYGTDPFNDMITKHLSEPVLKAFQKDPEQYAMAVEQLSNNIMSQVVNSFARKNYLEDIDGFLKTVGPRLFLRPQSLRIFQALLCLLTLARILQMTVLRPRTCLFEDPGSIASMAVLLATCEDNVSDMLSLETYSTDKNSEMSSKSLEPTCSSGQ